MTAPLTLCDVEAAIRDSFAFDTCSPDDLQDWSQQNKSRGHCAVTSLTLNDFFGGELLCAEVHVGQERIGYHWWNRFGRLEVDLTRDQFADHEIVGRPWTVDRPGGDHFYADQYALFCERVRIRLPHSDT
jgi:hypothetical protein